MACYLQMVCPVCVENDTKDMNGSKAGLCLPSTLVCKYFFSKHKCI